MRIDKLLLILKELDPELTVEVGIKSIFPPDTECIDLYEIKDIEHDETKFMLWVTAKPEVEV